MKAIVTGGSGFVGTNLIKRLLELDIYEQIISIDNYSSGSPNNNIKSKKVEYIHGHTKDFKYIAPSADVVYHLGEYSRIHPSFGEYDVVWRSNTIGTFEVIDWCKNRNVKLVYAASSTRFAKEGVAHSPYSFTKSMNVDLIKSFGEWYGLKYAICYFYNVFGPGYDSSPVPGYESVISVFEKQYKKGESLTVVGNGAQQRMFTYVKDIVEGLIKASQYDKNDEFDLVNPESYTILQIAKMFKDDIIFVPSRKGDRLNTSPPHYEDTCSKLNWHPTVSVKDWIELIKNPLY